jgi:hypothetical protein
MLSAVQVRLAAVEDQLGDALYLNGSIKQYLEDTAKGREITPAASSPRVSEANRSLAFANSISLGHQSEVLDRLRKSTGEGTRELTAKLDHVTKLVEQLLEKRGVSAAK